MTYGFFNSISKFLPESFLFLGIVSVIMVSILFKNKTGLSVYTTISFLILVLIFTLAQSGLVPQKIFSGIAVIDPFSLFFKILILVTALFTVYFSFISHEIITHENNFPEYFIFILGAVFGGFLMVSSVNLLVSYAGTEITGICIYFLSSYIKGSKRLSEASVRNITFGIISSGCMLFGISILYGLCGTIDLFEISSFLSVNTVNTITLLISVLLILTGFSYKIMAIPSYFTFPAIYESSPLPVPALISTTILVSGMGLMIRFFFTAFYNPVSTVQSPDVFNMIHSFPWYSVISIIAVFTITLANLAAIAQDNIKRVMFFISASQAGYVLLGIVSANPQGLTASLFYILIYLINTLGLFFCIILITNKFKTENIHSLKGLVQSAPQLAISFGVFLFSMAGFPLTAGFTGKFFIFSALMNNGYTWIVIAGAVNMIISLYLVQKICKNIFFLQPFKTREKFTLSSAENSILLVLLTPAIFGGVYFTPLMKLAELSTVILGLSG